MSTASTNTSRPPDLFRGRVAAWFGSLRTATAPQPQLSRWAWIADVLLAIVLAAGTFEGMRRQGGTGGIIKGLVNVPLGPAPPVPPGPLLDFGRAPAFADWPCVVAALMTLPLALRRRYPVAALWGVAIASIVLHTGARSDDASVFTFIACVLVAYGAVMYSPYRTLALTSAVAVALLLGTFHDSAVPDITPGFVPFILLLVIGLAANAVNGWKQRLQALEAEQAAATQSAVEFERARIARELHDVLTHNVSVMVVQAGAARKVMDAAPDQAREALLAVEAGGRAAMTELRHVMGLLTMSPDAPDDAAVTDLTPQPGLGQLDELVARVHEAGVEVSVSITGRPIALSAGADLAAYRVVQEALTNAVKHAVGSSIAISIDYVENAVQVDVTDTGGTSSSSANSGNGRGLNGLRDRLALYGGTLYAGRRPTGGYRVTAEIPVTQS
ncbi:MAG: sensor histidine kinase [Acidothermaceae bacterium]